MTLPARPILCLVTHGERIALGGRSPGAVADVLVAQAAEAARAGVDLVQVRELDFDSGPMTHLVARIVEAVGGTSTRVLVNDRLDVALAAGAHGVHLRGDSYPARRVRGLVPRNFLVGRSVHAADEAATVVRDGGVDFLVFGTVFQSASKPAGYRPAGLEALARVVDAASGVPVLAIGGVSVGSVPLVAAAGASGVAAMGLFLPGEAGASRTIADTVAGLRTEFDTVGDVH